MAYVPPKYPGAIPTAEDLPDRTDDVDWMYAARYNELKKELRAALTELGADPAGTFATVKARLDDLLPHFHDRGDPAAYDFTYGDLTHDNAYHDLDLSSIVPAGAKNILLYVVVTSSVINKRIAFRKNGNINELILFPNRERIANLTYETNPTIPCDTGRVVEYKSNFPAGSVVAITVGGWWK